MSEQVLRQLIVSDMTLAMKGQKKVAVKALRLIYADCKNQEIALKAPLSNAQVITILKKHIKQYKESIVQYEQAGSLTLLQEQKDRLALVQSYLPQALSEKELKQIIEESVAEVQAHSLKSMGLVMKSVGAKVCGRADNRLVAQLVKERLQNL